MARKRGTKPKPLARHKLDGTYRATRHRDRQEAEYAVGDMKPPPELNAEAQKEWARVAPLLASQGVWTEVDRTTFATFCQAHADYFAMVKALNAKKAPGMGTMERKRMIGERDSAYRIIKDMAARFGFTPSDRAGLPIHKPDAEVDPVDAFLAGPRGGINVVE